MGKNEQGGARDMYKRRQEVNTEGLVAAIGLGLKIRSALAERVDPVRW